MFEVKVNDHIASAHVLHGYDGPCSRLHGHTWKIEVTVTGSHLDNIGLLTDFKVLKKKLKEVIMPLDHVVLNELSAFNGMNPSTENLAKYIYTQFKPLVSPLQLKCVQVWESDTASIIYYE